MSRGRLLLAAVVVGWLAVGLWTLANFTVAGSASHANAWVSALANCPADEGEAVADGSSQPGAQERCQDEGLRRLGAFFVASLALGAVVGVVAARVVFRQTKTALSTPT